MADNKKYESKEEKVKEEIIRDIEKAGVPEKVAEKEEKIAEKEEKLAEKAEEKSGKKETGKKEEKKKPKPEAVANSYNAHLSTKTSAAVCRFIIGKTPEKAMEDLEKVARGKMAVPMKGEIPHRKGKGMMSGRFPKNAAEHFTKLVKSLAANAATNGIENPVIVEAFANIGSRPFGRFGSVRRKRTHIKITVKNKAVRENKKQKEKK